MLQQHFSSTGQMSF